MPDVSVEELLELGLIHEVNRRFFHPIGMELRVAYDEGTQTFSLDGVTDKRGAPEGIVFGNGHEPAPMPEAAMTYERMLKSTSRTIAYGYVVQPVFPLEPIVVESVEKGKPMPREIKAGPG